MVIPSIGDWLVQMKNPVNPRLTGFFWLALCQQ
jgi:hypothetical protein